MIGKKIAVFILIFAVLTAVPNVLDLSFFTGAGTHEKAAVGTASPDEASPSPSPTNVNYNGTEYAPNANVFNILLLGIDSDETREAQNMSWRSDMIELCTIDLSADTMALTAIPRDTMAKIYYVDITGKTTQSITDKVNAAYSYGGGPDKFGAQNAQRCISELLSVDGKYNVPINAYISIDLAGISNFASVLGGISLPLDVDFPGLGQKGQVITLDERNAILYLSNRKQVGGDLVRDSHEQQYMIAVAKKIKEQGAVAAAPKLYASLMQYVKTNLSLSQILTVAGILDKMSMDNIKTQIIGGNAKDIDSISYYIADLKDVESKVVQLMYVPVHQ